MFTAVLSAAAFNYFHLPPTGRFTIADSRHWVALAIFLVAAVVASAVAELARSRAVEAEQRRREADLAAALARILLGGAGVEAALGSACGASGRRARARRGVDRARARRLRGRTGSSTRCAAASGRSAGSSSPTTFRRPCAGGWSERVVPALEALLAAALERDRLQAEVVETQALRRSDELKTALLRSVSHDLRTR